MDRRRGSRRAPARVLAVPPPGGPRHGYGPPPPRPLDAESVLPPRPSGAHRAPPRRRRPAAQAVQVAQVARARHRRTRLHLTDRGRFVVGVALTAVISTSYMAAAHGRSDTSQAAPAPAAATPTTAPSPAAAASTSTVPAAVAQAVDAAGAPVAVAVYDAVTQRTWAYRDKPGQTVASLSKLQLLGAELAGEQAGTLKPTVDKILAAMVERSDNASADKVFARVHRAGQAAFVTAVGATDVDPADRGEFGYDTSSAAAQVSIMRAFAYPNGVLTDASRTRAQTLLRAVQADQRWGATGGVPAGVTVEIKDGWLPVTGGWAVNSVAHVHGAGRDYVVALMSQGGATEQAGIDRITKVAAAVWSTAGS